MILKHYNSIMRKSENERQKWALGLSVSLSVFIFFGWAFVSGYLNFSDQNAVMAESNLKKDSASIVLAEDALTPIESSKETFGAAFQEIGKKYNEIKNSMSSVLVPFVTGIEIYERK